MTRLSDRLGAFVAAMKTAEDLRPTFAVSRSVGDTTAAFEIARVGDDGSLVVGQRLEYAEIERFAIWLCEVYGVAHVVGAPDDAIERVVKVRAELAELEKHTHGFVDDACAKCARIRAIKEFFGEDGR